MDLKKISSEDCFDAISIYIKNLDRTLWQNADEVNLETFMHVTERIYFLSLYYYTSINRYPLAEK